MNKHLLASRLKSLAHYTIELQNFKDAVKVTEATREDVLQSLREFFLYNPGDILFYRGQLFKITSFEKVSQYTTGIRFSVMYQYPDKHGDWGAVERWSKEICIEDQHEAKVIHLSEKSELEINPAF